MKELAKIASLEPHGFSFGMDDVGLNIHRQCRCARVSGGSC